MDHICKEFFQGVSLVQSQIESFNEFSANTIDEIIQENKVLSIVQVDTRQILVGDFVATQVKYFHLLTSSGERSVNMLLHLEIAIWAPPP